MRHYYVAEAEMDDLLPDLWKLCNEQQWEMLFDPCHHVLDVQKLLDDGTRAVVLSLTILPVCDAYSVIRELKDGIE